MNRRRYTLAGSLAVCVLAAVATLAAQSAGTIQGEVRDAAGVAVRDAAVTIELQGAVPGSARRFSTTTGEDGGFVQKELPAGRYRVTAFKGGAGLQSFGVRVHAGATADVVFQLAPDRAGMAWIDEIDRETLARVRELFERASQAAGSARYDEAVAAYEQAIEIAPRCHQCYYNLGLTHSMRGALPDAEQSLKKAIEVKPDYVEAYHRLAHVYSAQQKYGLAQEASREAARFADTTVLRRVDENPADLRFDEAVVMWNAGQVAQAREKFLEVLRLEPDRADAQYWVAMSYLSEQRVPEATAAFERYLEMAPEGQYALQVRQTLDSLRLRGAERGDGVPASDELRGVQGSPR
jgi:Flp pilus assembly protein TadD